MGGQQVTSSICSVQRDPVEGTCPACGRAELACYPVCSEGGWFLVVKCQQCLHSVSRERWALLGHLTLLVDQV